MVKFTKDISPNELFYKLQEYNNELLNFAADMDVDAFNNYITESDIERFIHEPVYEAAIAVSRMIEPIITINGVQSIYQFNHLPQDSIIRNSSIADDIKQFQEQLNKIGLTALNDFLTHKKLEADETEYHVGEVLNKIQNPKRELDADTIDAIIDYKIELIEDYSCELDTFVNQDILKLHRANKTRTNTDAIPSMIQKIRTDITSLIKTREHLIMRLNFQILDDGIRDKKKYPSTLNERLSTAKTLKEQFQILAQADDTLHKNLEKQNMSFLDMRNYYLIDNTPNGNKRKKTSILFRNYLEGKGINRINYHRFTNAQKVESKLFYYELAMFLGLPSKYFVQRFLELNGISIDPITPIHTANYVTKSGLVKLINFFEHDILRWINCGVDTNTINSIMGFQLEKKVKPRKKMAE